MHSTPGIDSPVIGIQTAGTEYISPVLGIPPQTISGGDHTTTQPDLLHNYAVSAAILEIFIVKEWPDREISVWGPSRSLKMARFDRPCMTFYKSAIVTIALSCTICELFDVE